MALNPYSRDAINNLAATYIQTNQFPKAFPLIDKLVALDPSNPDNPLLYAFAYQGLYKGTKDKKLQKIYTDSLVYFNGKSENVPVKLAVTEFTRRPDQTTLAGTIENRGTAAKTYTVNVEFLDKSGDRGLHGDDDGGAGGAEEVRDVQDHVAEGRGVRVSI